MNKQRREQISQAAAQIRGAVEILNAAKDEEQEYFDNMPESSQSGEKGSAAEEAISNLDSAIESANEAADYAEGIE